jgi:hypothetical protein
VGHLFQGRYKAVLCQKDEYLLELVRYIHLNPVRAGIVKDPKNYLWSSHRGLLGLEKNPRCDVNAVLKLFGGKKNVAIKQYRSFVLDAIGLGHQSEFYQWKDQRILGKEEFANELLAKEDARDGAFYYDISMQEIVEAVAKELGVPSSVICSRRRNRLGSFCRGVVAYLAKTMTGASLKDIGKYFFKGEAALAHRYRMVEERMHKDRDLKEAIQSLSNILPSNKPRRFK